MPMEGQWQRQHTPLRLESARERRVVAIVAAALVVAAVAVTLYLVLAGSDSSTPAPGCIHVAAASSLGGATVEACGADAQRLCSQVAHETTPLAHAVRPQCDRIAGPSGAPTGP